MKPKEIDKADIEILMDVDFLVSVIVAIGEVANITGVPQRKIRYWDEKGIIEPVDKTSTYRQYNYLNIKKVVLVQELLDEGFTLDAAAKKVNERYTKVAEVFKRVSALKDHQKK
ncbi:MerR family transcriptional regulator [Pedobacter sp. L105]|uniref:MerR family transcriptional regulator n=1 Tax=Pedobacter sp. L105 TaxID=1641871 RepID=UPI00131D3CE9|nr:MerR family transcriptional regulator [Pedobacter sp. L105]